MDYEIFETKERALADNDAAARATREELAAKGIYFINLMGAPGSGKTSLLTQLIPALAPLRVGVMEADVDSDVDAKAVAGTGAKVIQLHTAGLCHMDADMTRRGLDRLGAEGLDVIFLENIGNLVCPAEFEVGADLRLTVLSVPEGDDKPLKYPLMFHITDCVIVSKTDTLPIFDFDLAALRERMAGIRPEVPVFPLSVQSGEGLEALIAWLRARIGGKRS